MPDSYVVVGAMSKCSSGSLQARLRMPLSHGVYINGKAQMNMADALPQANIPGYGSCSPLRGPCAPATCVWLGCKADVEIEGRQALLKSSVVICAVGGTITITDDGQEG